MWVLQGDNVTKCSLIIIDVDIAWLVKKTNEIFWRLVQVLWGENIIECSMKYSYVSIIACPNKHYVYY
jgi:hypothetical protein